MRARSWAAWLLVVLLVGAEATRVADDVAALPDKHSASDALMAVTSLVSRVRALFARDHDNGTTQLTQLSTGMSDADLRKHLVLWVGVLVFPLVFPFLWRRVPGNLVWLQNGDRMSAFRHAVSAMGSGGEYFNLGVVLFTLANGMLSQPGLETPYMGCVLLAFLALATGVVQASTRTRARLLDNDKPVLRKDP